MITHNTPQHETLTMNGAVVRVAFITHIDGVDIWCDQSSVPYCLVYSHPVDGNRWIWTRAPVNGASWMSTEVINFVNAHALLTT